MLSLNEVKTGRVVKYNEKPYQVLWSEHTKVGRGGAILRSKIKDLTTGVIIDKTFKGNEKIEELELDKKKYQYLYAEENEYFFMDPISFEQISLNAEQVGDNKNYLFEGVVCEIIFYEGNPISLILPIKMTFEITYTEPGLKGDTKSSSSSKPAKIQTGATIQVPLFIENGEKIIVDTRTGKYIERA